MDTSNTRTISDVLERKVFASKERHMSLYNQTAYYCIYPKRMAIMLTAKINNFINNNDSINFDTYELRADNSMLQEYITSFGDTNSHEILRVNLQILMNKCIITNITDIYYKYIISVLDVEKICTISK
ncbi:MAG: hypothetical protein Gaeavirus1_39 [Gaeavirus sp.]|uniref:Uncharacterized protein n=1 Tax=Gaeavirus sp. TaxID=2487767 RepID=A0A3G4ZYC2_9VIRU|nr:MAG: hypothetical protein Gaeavirus1_39 [Gaeavirus sp.]